MSEKISLVTIKRKHQIHSYDKQHVIWLFTIKLMGEKRLPLSLPILTPVDALPHRLRERSGRGFLALHRPPHRLTAPVS